MNKNNKPIIAAIIIVALLIIIGAVFASGILAHDDDEQAAYEVNFIDGEQVIKTITVKENHLVTRINDPVKEGYIFAGWYTDQELTNEFTFDDTYITNDLTLYAKWVKASEPEPGDITYTVTFNTNGANSISPQIVKAGEKAVKPADPLKSGYKFVGWYSDSSFTTLFDFQSPITFDITLYAKFTSTGGGGGGSVTPPVTPGQTFTVEFISEGVQFDLQIIKQGNKAEMPTPDPIKEGYTFTGWYEQNSSIKFDFNTPITSDLTLSAKWIAGTYTPDGSGGVTVDINTEQINDLVNSAPNDKIEIVDTSANEDVNKVIISSEVLGQVQTVNNSAKDVVVTTAQGSIALSSNVVTQLISTAQSTTNDSQDTSDISITITADEKPYTYQITITTNDNKPVTHFSEPITISIPYTLKEGENPNDIAVYYIKGNERILVYGTYNGITECVEITTDHLSTYEIKNTAQYAVIFDSNGGTLSIENLSVYSKREFGSLIKEPANPTKDGYTFAGWFKDKDCTQAWNFDSDTVRGESYEITLYAKWTPISYDITYNLDDGVNNPNNPASYNIESDTITLQSPTKAGHTFLGWFDESNHKVTSIVKGSTGDLQLTAIWELNQYTVTLASGENYTLEPLAKSASTVNHGDDFSFKVTADNSLNLAVKANSQTIEPAANGIYTITNITEDQIVTVEGVNSTNYKVTFVPHEGYIANSISDTVAAGESFSFTIELTDAYSQSSAIEVMAIGYGKLTAQNGIYTIADVNADLIIYLNGLQKNTYTVTFDYDNGSDVVTQQINHGDKVSKPSTPIKTGYSFEQWTAGEVAYDFNTSVTSDLLLKAKWNALTSVYYEYIYQETLNKGDYALHSITRQSGTTDSELTPSNLYPFEGFSYNSEKSINDSDKTIKADGSSILKIYYDRNSYNLIFKSNDVPITTESKRYGETILPISVTQEGYILSGWYESDPETPYLFSIMPAKDVTLYANWIKIYKVTYDANGGSGELPLTVGYAANTTIYVFGPGYPTEDSYQLTREGYTFGGWAYDGETYKPGDKLTITNADVTLSARWTPVSYTVTFESNGGYKVDSITANYGTKITKPVDPKRAGYTFAGWFKDVELTQAWDFAADTVPLNGTTLYAKWTLDTYTLKFYNGDVSVKSIDYTIETKSMTLPEFSQEGYTFTGWFEKGSSSAFFYSPGVTVGNKDLYANLKINHYTITFDSNGGSNAGSVTLDYGTQLGPLPTPTYEGHTFLGWFEDNETFNNKFTAETTMPAKDITLYAKWEPNKYTLTINYVYEDGSSASESYIGDLDYNSSYSVESPEVVGYLPDLNVVSGTLTKDTVIMVTYGAYVASVGEKNYRTLEDALNNAVAGDKVILLRDYTLTQNVTVPQDVFLVLPCADDDQGYDLTAKYEEVHNPDGTSSSSEDLSVLYCTLTIPSDVTLNVEGQVLVNAVTGRPAAGHYNMDITGGYAQIQLEGNIIVQDGAILEVCGYIKGNGQVTAESGSEIRELFVVIHWRGGSQAFRVFPSVFPFSEYDCHSIQSTLYLESGALLSGNVKMYAQNRLVTPAPPPQYFHIRFPQIGENGLIQLNDGAHLIRTYDANASNGSSESDHGRTYFEIFGGGKFSHSTLSIIGIDMSTKNFTYPVDGDISIGLHDGNYVSEDNFKILTGAQVTIYDNASLTVIEGKHLVFYDEFIDPDNVDNTEYPDRPAALLVLHDNAVLNINGSFAGIIDLIGSGTGTVNVGNNASLAVTTKESNGLATPSVREITFETKYQYTIVLDRNDGSEQTSMKYISGDKIELPTLERSGYDFQGWYLDTALTQLCDSGKIISGNITLYAKWSESEYVISFETKNGTAIESQKLKYNDLVSKPADPVRLGYKFTGWYTDAECNTPYAFDTLVTESFSLYAGWELQTYSITYELGGGINHANNPHSYTVESAQVFLSPTKEGYDFKGWYTSLDPLSEEITNTSGKAADLTLYALWEIKTYIVTLNYGADLPSKTIDKEYLSTLNESELLVERAGYTLTSWYRDDKYTTPWNFTEDKVINHVTLYAKWTPIEYSITYNLDKGINHDDNPDQYNIESTVTFKEPTRIGHTFQGWFADADFTTEITAIQTGETGDLTLYAKWTAIDYKITFVDWDDAELSSKTYHYGDTVIAPENPLRAADNKYTYTFKAWTPAVVTVTGDATYQAVYSPTPINYNITYELDGGTNGDNPASYHCESAAITLKDPVKEGHTFQGWFTDANFTNKVSIIPTGTTGDLTFYAKWQIKTFTVAVPTSLDYEIKYAGSTTVNYGSSFAFTVELAEAYSSSEIVVKANGVAINKEADGSYVITNITADQQIAVEGIVKNSYTVTIPTADGYAISPATTTVDYGGNFTFTFTLAEAYSQSNYIIKVNGTAVALVNNQYTISDITSDITITVEGVEKNQYTVTFNYDNGSEATTSQITHGEQVTKPADPAKKGYTFKEWQLAEATYDFSLPVTADLTLTATWTANTYEVIFDGNGSTAGSMVNQPFTYDVAQALTANAFAKTGHTFAGWSTVQNAAETEYTDKQSVINLIDEGSITLYAVWTAQTFSISYNNNGGEGTIAPVNVVYGSEVTLSNGQSFSRNGYQLSGWNTAANGSGTSYALSYKFASWNLTDDLTLYAQWTLIDYSISYNLDGGTNHADNPAQYTIESATITLKNPTRTGYAFQGWYRNSDFSGSKVETIPQGSTGSITLYANWTLEQYTITFNSNGGTPQPTQISYTINTTTVTLPNNLTRDGYTFDKWCADENLTTEFMYEPGATTGNTTLYAKWNPVPYSITYELNGGKVSGNPDSYTIESATITLNNPTKEGYTFAGWTGTDLTGAQTSVQIAQGSIGDRAYTATWTANTYEVIFNGNGSTTGSMADQSFTYDVEQVLTANAFAKTGHTFAGWSTEKNAAEAEYTDNHSVKNLTTAGSITLYAIWSINYYTITLPSDTLTVEYTTAAVSGYNPDSVIYGSDFQFTVTFSGDIGDNTPIIAYGNNKLNGASTADNTYTFTIKNVSSDLKLSLSLVSNLTIDLEKLVQNNNSAEYKLSLSGTTLTVSIINPKADAADLISKILEATGEQSIAANSNSGRTDAASTFLAYLPDDDTLWQNNTAEYVVELGGCKIVFKQDAEAIEEAKIQYLTEIAQAVRMFRDNTNWYPRSDLINEVISTSAGIELDTSDKYIDVALLMTTYDKLLTDGSGDPNQKIEIYAALMTNFATVMALVGHEDAISGYYSDDRGDLEKFSKVSIGNINDGNLMQRANELLPIAINLLQNMGVKNVSTASDPIAYCFDEGGIGVDGYAKQLCTSKETGIRYTDIYHLKFSNYFDSNTKPALYSITIDGTLEQLTLQNVGAVDDGLITLVYKILTSSNPLVGGISQEDIDSLSKIDTNGRTEFDRFVPGELIVINTPGYDRSNLSVITNGTEIIWYNDHAFIMPEGDVTISLKTASTAETPVISAQPQSLNLSSGDSAELSITAAVTDGGKLSYVWYKGLNATDNLAEESKKVGTTQTYALPTNLSVGSHYYFCVVTNTLDNTSAAVTSDIVTVQISNKTYSITFNTNGGNAIDGTDYTNLQEGAALSLPSPENFGYLFEGWYTNTALTLAAPSEMPAKNLTLYAKWNNVLSPDGTVTEFANVGDKAWTYDEQTGAYHSEYGGVSGEADYSTTLPEFSVTLASSGILSFDYLLKSNKAPENLTQDGLGYKFSKISLYVFYDTHLSFSDDPAYLNGSFAVTGDTWGKASIAIDVAEGESVTVHLAYAKMADESTDADGLWIKNLSLSLTDLHLTVDVNNAEYGSVTAVSGGEPLVIGSENSLQPSSEVTLTAVPNTGYKFYCWVDENNNTLSTKAEYKFSLINNMKVTAVFGSEVETQYAAHIGKNFYPTLKAALDDAKAGDKLTLLKDYEMSESATVKAGVSLLLPCMDNDIGYAANGYNPNGTTTTVKALYRTLTIPENVTLTVEGSVLVNAVTGYPSGGDYDQDVRGGYAQINLSGEIIVNNGGLLDNCGYILGSGQVTANAGAEVRDLYVVKHWDGGSHANGAYDDGIFPFTEYDCHNIQTTLYMESGASLYGTVKMYALYSFNYTRFPQIDNTNGLIRLADGAHLIKTYDPDAVNGAANDQGRVSIVIDGGATFSSSTLRIVGLSLSTKSYVYPVDGDIAFVLNNGDYVVENDFKVLPGCTIVVSENSTLTTAADTTVVFYQNTNVDGVNNGKGWDTYSNAPVRYPAERPDAYLQLSAGSSFTANGSFGGFIQAENASVTLNGGTSCVTKETISTSGSTFNADTEFKEITTTAQLQKSSNDHKVLFNFVKEGVTGYQISTAAELPTVQTAGLTFDGWYKGDLPITSLSEISEDAVLTAKWL